MKRFSLRNVVPLCAAVLLLPILAACGDSETLPPEKVLENASAAIQKVNTFRFSLETNKPQKPLPGLFLSKAEGAVAKPDKLTANIDATYAGLPVNVKVVVDGKNQYMTDPASGKWTTMLPMLNISQFFDLTKGVSDLFSNMKNVTSDGKENVDGTNCYRLNGTAPTSALKAFSPEVTAQGELTATLWIGTGDFLLRRARLQGPLISTEPADIVRTFSFKDYDKEIKIETPIVEK